MAPWSTITSAALLLASATAPVAGHPPTSDYINAAIDFGNSFLSPRNAEIAQGIIAPSLATNITGRIDISTNFFGGELNTEYIWGLFANVAQSTNLSLVGSPIKNSLQELVAEPPIVSTSMIVDFDYPLVNFTLPVQIDFWLRFDDDLKITSYDVIFRRWPQAYTYLIPKILPVIAVETGTTLGPTTDIAAMVTQFAAQQICEVEANYCTGDNQQYDSKAACLQFLTTQIPLGNPWEGGLNTIICRYLHKNMVSYRPQVHCPHIGPTGGDMCIARDYVDIVRNPPFTESLVAPNITSW